MRRREQLRHVSELFELGAEFDSMGVHDDVHQRHSSTSVSGCLVID